ncbi:MAG: DUF2796 domain-containing protein [Boseongicola sp.]|nr:DUF2796 domain-containing protein [Boseongicola sp.]
MKNTTALLFILTSAPVYAESVRELNAHEHGLGELNIAIDGSTVVMELFAPGSDIVGFEYEAKNTEDRAAVDAAVATLAKPLDLFVLNAAAECNVIKSSASLESEDEHEDHDEHGHVEHADAEDHEDAETSHTEFHAEYTLNCGDPEKLAGIEFAYFDAFPNALELEVQIVTSTGAQAFDVERETPSLNIRGMF